MPGVLYRVHEQGNHPRKAQCCTTSDGDIVGRHTEPHPYSRDQASEDDLVRHSAGRAQVV